MRPAAAPGWQSDSLSRHQAQYQTTIITNPLPSVCVIPIRRSRPTLVASVAAFSYSFSHENLPENSLNFTVTACLRRQVHLRTGSPRYHLEGASRHHHVRRARRQFCGLIQRVEQDLVRTDDASSRHATDTDSWFRRLQRTRSFRHQVSLRMLPRNDPAVRLTTADQL